MNKRRKDKESLDSNGRYFFSAFVILIQAVFLNLQLTGNANAQGTTSVAVVNVTFLMENAPQSEAASNLLKEKFLPQEENLAKHLEAISQLETELEKITASNTEGEVKRQKERELRSEKRKRNRSLQDFREELRFARDAALDVVQKEVFNAIDKVREEQNIDIVLQDYVSASKEIDITPSVLVYLKRQLETVSEFKKEK